MKGFTPGGIRSPEAYAQGKMLDHSSWYGELARGITPSDIDAVVESYGQFIFMEFSRECESLADLKKGQRMMLRALSRLPGNHCVAVVRHAVFSHSKQINTATDVETAYVYFDMGQQVAVLDRDEWVTFVTQFTHFPNRAIEECLRSKITTQPKPR